MQLQWFGYYFDGQSAIRRNARIYLEPGNLRIDLDDGTILTWPYAAIRQTQGAYAGEHVRLEHGGEPVEVLLIDDDSFLASLHQLMPSRAGGFHNPAKRFQRFQLTLLPLARRLRWLSEAIFGASRCSLKSPRHGCRCHGKSNSVKACWSMSRRRSSAAAIRYGWQELENLVGAMVATQGETKYRFKIHVVNQPMFNALAAPGGHIVIFRGLLDRTENAEELAGVLAHELQHILKLHVTRSLLEYASTSFLVAAVLGDASGMVSFGVEAAQMLAQMRFSRQHELEADEAGLQMLLAASIDPAGMIAFFEAVGKDEGQMATALSYVSTHPQAELRIARLKNLIAASAASYQKLLPDYSWEDIKKICPAPVNPSKE